MRTPLGSREGSGRFQGEGRVRRSRTTRHVVVVALRRQSSACAHGNGDAWRGRADWGPVWVNPVAGRGFWPGRAARGRRPRLGRHRTEEGERNERVKRKRDLIDSKFKFFSKISVETWKTLNMKAVENFEFYTFCFRHQFV